ncbi:fluoride efflux transporter CrcB [Microtetraspora sp. AC03309]|uniref:fluoride efflux transporter CrcB n=1 Tax=Microtetraspora sp. AC03309 TaxID=2779376 RepID=UPI001E4256A5|nr:fluoride efflux transporter CrcB [Microtetraspora sp. AC03309]MCC5580743.1 fluoride efflux transporter CrcB [Microtetraspora sp. AC03309]
MTPHEADVFRARPARARSRTFGVLGVIAVGGGLGSIARYLVGSAIPAGASGFPWGTLVVNVTGCFVLGVLMVFVLQVWPPRRYVRPFLGVGFLGGYTTFSTVMVEITRLSAATAVTYAAASLAAGLAAVWCGMTIARLATRLPVRRNAREEA